MSYLPIHNPSMNAYVAYIDEIILASLRNKYM